MRTTMKIRGGLLKKFNESNAQQVQTARVLQKAAVFFFSRHEHFLLYCLRNALFEEGRSGQVFSDNSAMPSSDIPAALHHHSFAQQFHWALWRCGGYCRPLICLLANGATWGLHWLPESFCFPAEPERPPFNLGVTSNLDFFLGWALLPNSPLRCRMPRVWARHLDFPVRCKYPIFFESYLFLVPIHAYKYIF